MNNRYTKGYCCHLSTQERKKRIATPMHCLLRFTILHSHGNAVDLGQMSSFYLSLGSKINCNIFSYDYSGYGVSTGIFYLKMTIVNSQHALTSSDYFYCHLRFLIRIIIKLGTEKNGR